MIEPPCPPPPTPPYLSAEKREKRKAKKRKEKKKNEKALQEVPPSNPCRDLETTFCKLVPRAHGRLLRNATEKYNTDAAKMADDRDELTFLPVVKANAAKRGKKNKRIGFKNINKPLILPSLELSTVDVQLVSSLFSHKQICKKVCEWFTGWRSWQQRILLCGVSDKCTKGQLQALVTTLEPVFHRDFAARLKGIYPTSLIQARLVRTAPVMPARPSPSFSAEQLMIALQPSQEIDQSNSLITGIEQENLKDGDSDSFHTELGELQTNFSDTNIIADRMSGSHMGSPIFHDRGTEMTASAHTVQPALDVEENRRHEHAPPFLRRVSTPNFFPKLNHQQLGYMKTALRTGDTDRLYGNAPVTFKHDKWWEGHKGARLVKPRKSKLSNHFRSQISQVHQVLLLYIHAKWL